MQAGFLVKPGQIELRELPVPEPEPGEVIAKVHTALTCGTDLKTYRRGHPKVSLPSPFGHEFSGSVHALGNGVEGFKEGDSIMTVFSSPCGECYHCRRNEEHLCTELKNSLMFGAYAEYIRIPESIVSNNMFKKPHSLSFRQAAMLEPLSCVIHGVDETSPGTDDSILVIGAGTIGLLFTAVLKTMNPKKLIVAARGEERIAVANALGADSVIDAANENVLERVHGMTDGIGVNIVIESTGSKEVWESSVDYLSKNGKVILFGGLAENSTVTFDAERLHYDNIRLQGVFHYRRKDVVAARELLISDQVHLEPLITKDYPLGDLKKAFQLLDEKKGIKYAILP